MAKESQAQLPEPVMKVWRPQGFAGVEVERFDNIPRLTFPPTVLNGHDLTVSHRFGFNKFKYGRKQYSLRGGRRKFFTQHAGEVFAATPHDDELTTVWTLRLYPDAMQQLKAVLGSPNGFSYFPEMMAPQELNEPLANLTTDAVLAFDEPTSTLERESKLFGLVRAVLEHCSDTPPPEMRFGKEHRAVSIVKEVLQTHPEFDHTLDDLAYLTKLSKFYLQEVFKLEVGLSPDQYQIGVRVHRAKDLLAQGSSISQTAHALGFYDQSHLTNVFKKYVQVTPGKFRRDSLAS